MSIIGDSYMESRERELEEIRELYYQLSLAGAPHEFLAGMECVYNIISYGKSEISPSKNKVKGDENGMS